MNLTKNILKYRKTEFKRRKIWTFKIKLNKNNNNQLTERNIILIPSQKLTPELHSLFDDSDE